MVSHRVRLASHSGSRAPCQPRAKGRQQNVCVLDCCQLFCVKFTPATDISGLICDHLRYLYVKLCLIYIFSDTVRSLHASSVLVLRREWEGTFSPCGVTYV